MDYLSSVNNLSEYISKLDQEYPENKDISSYETLILDNAKSLGLDIVSSENFYYIKKGDNPKALLHLNIDYFKQKISFACENNDKNKIIKTESSINLLTSSILINYLLRYSQNSFDVLLTHNNIHISESKYTGLGELLRTDKVINLNLRQADCIADEFSTLKLFLNQVKIKRFSPNYDYASYRISINDLSGGHAGEEADKIKLNAIKFLIAIIRKIKAKVDLDIVNLVGGERYDSIPSSSYVDFVIDTQYEADLVNIFDIIKNETIEKNLKYEPDMSLDLRKIENKKKDPINNESFNHLASFIELIPLGSFFVNSVDDQTISSSNLATARSLRNYINLIIVLRSLSEESMRNMIGKIELASTISDSTLTEKLNLEKWKNIDAYLTDVFKDSYKTITGEELEVIKTQYSLDSSIIFKDLNVKIVSIGVKYKQADSVYYSRVEDLEKVLNLLELALSKIN